MVNTTEQELKKYGIYGVLLLQYLKDNRAEDWLLCSISDLHFIGKYPKQYLVINKLIKYGEIELTHIGFPAKRALRLKKKDD